MIYFNNDYMRGAHPLVLQRLIDTNLEQTAGYGDDNYTRQARQRILDFCGLTDGEVHFLVGGTQTNATVIDGLLARHEGVLATRSAHIHVHESGAIEASGHRVITLDEYEGKLSADIVRQFIDDFYRDETYEHMVAPGMVYISHPTELGTLYTLDELKALSKVCRDAEIPLYMDGARLGYGLAADDTDVTAADIARLCDVFYIGGTKAGALFGEAVVIPQKDKLPHFRPLIKQHGALLAKGRLTALQFDALFTDSLYLKISRHAIRMAMKLKEGLLKKGYPLLIDSPTNQQFFILPNADIDRLATSVSFELWGPRQEALTPVRFVTDWSTDEADVDALLNLIS
ncbi:MAG: beta-eliminating lyase-related protein [Prevotellaceae bacterium]|nr:beta-eliminating lyase-related protein [Prevotellaceae bacterium]